MSEEIAGTANIRPELKCGDCGWPIVFACCNGLFMNFKDADQWDWWYYCSNKGCEHHDGEGTFQRDPDWVLTIHHKDWVVGEKLKEARDLMIREESHQPKPRAEAQQTIAHVTTAIMWREWTMEVRGAG